MYFLILDFNDSDLKDNALPGLYITKARECILNLNLRLQLTMPVVLRTAEEVAAAWMNYKIEKGMRLVWKTVEGVHQRLKSENACTRKKVQGGARRGRILKN